MTTDNRGRPKLFLVDGMPVLYRSHFVFLRNPRFTSAGLNTSALYGLTTSVLQVIEKQKPTHIAVVFDSREPTFRHTLYPAYKATRQQMPEDLAKAVPIAHNLIRALRIASLCLPGHEADDVIGSLACRASAAGFDVYMLTPDKDCAQLVGDHVFLCRPTKPGQPPEIMGVPEVLQEWGVARMDQVVDVLALAGDAVDNIPGVPGVGMKTAVRLLAEFGSLEAVLAGTGTLKGKLRENLEKYAEQARLSKVLATIDRAAPIELDLASLAVRSPDKVRLKQMFRDLEFANLGARVFGEEFVDHGPLFAAAQASQPAAAEAEDADVAPAEPVVPAWATLGDVPHDYRICATHPERVRLAQELATSGGFCFDTETTGLDARSCGLVGMSFCCKEGTAWYVPVPADQEAAQQVLDAVRGPLEDAAVPKTGQNLKYDITVLRAHGVQVRGPLFDTMLAHYVVDPSQRHGMDHLARVYLKYDPIPITKLIGPRGPDQKTMRDVPVEEAAQYAAEDADVTWRLRHALLPLLRERDGLRILNECENPLIPVLVDMEMEGVAIDTRALAEYSAVLGADMQRLEQEIFAAAGTSFNLSSPKQLGEVLFVLLKLEEHPAKTATGQYATNEEVLLRLANKHRIARLMLDHRSCQKLKSTYVDALPKEVSPHDGRVHTTYNQTAAATGRLQSENPNLQNIPIRRERGREIRKAFVPRGPGFLLLAADYSQIELRIMAELSGDPGLRDAFAQGLDVHRATAANVYGVSLDLVSDEMRGRAKMVNFGIMYGMSAFGLAQRLGIGRTEAADLIRQYFARYPGVKAYIDRTIATTRERGFVQTLLGRRRYFEDIRSRNAATRAAAEREAINTPIQGTAAEMIKVAMIRIHAAFSERNFRTRMVLQVHDELVFDMWADEEAVVREVVGHHMRTAIPMSVPIEVAIMTGANWLDAH